LKQASFFEAAEAKPNHNYKIKLAQISETLRTNNLSIDESNISNNLVPLATWQHNQYLSIMKAELPHHICACFY